MPIQMSLFWELVKREIGPRNEAVCRHLADEALRSRHDAGRAGPPFVSETSLRHDALQQEAAVMHVVLEARRSRASGRPEHAKRRRPGIVRLLRRAWRLVGRLPTT